MRKVVGNAGQKGDPDDRVEDESTVRTLGDEQLQMRISRADLHGAFIKIVRSTNKKMVGLEGKDHRTKSGFFHRYLPFTTVERVFSKHLWIAFVVVFLAEMGKIPCCGRPESSNSNIS